MKFNIDKKSFNWNFESNKNLLEIIKIHLKWAPQDIVLAFIQKSMFGLNTSQIKHHLIHLKFTSQENNDHEIYPFQPKKPKILENVMDPNVSFNSLIFPPIIQLVKLEKMLKQIKNDVNQVMTIKCDVRCDNMVKDNLIGLTSKNHILIKEKITPIENIQLKRYGQYEMHGNIVNVPTKKETLLIFQKYF